MRKLLFLLLLASHTAFAEPWEAKDKTLFYSYLGLNIADVIQTRKALKMEGGYEVNHIYGGHPTIESVIAGKAIGVAITYLVVDNSKHRTSVLIAANFMQLLIVRHNHFELNF